jgi:hypothetical protein
MARVITFGAVPVGRRFSFRFGVAGERSGWVKVTPRSYADARTGQRFSVATTKIECRLAARGVR